MTSPLPPIGHLQRLIQLLRSRPVFGQIAWVVAPFGVQQVVRLGTQIVLARLLAPEIFGLMLLVNTLRTGAELLSDIGIGQSIVRSPRGEERHFLDVAWTLQLVRGLLLTGVMLALALPLAQLYDQPELFPIIVWISPIFIITGLLSPALFVAQRQMRIRTRGIYDLVTITFQCVVTIVAAWIVPTVWALVFGLLASAIFTTLCSYVLDRNYRPRLAWDRSRVAEIFNFGKWIFLSTVLYFAATSFDRMYFVGVLSLALAGVFGIARTFSDLLGALSQRVGAYVLFPKVASLGDGVTLDRLRSTRLRMLALVAVGTGLAVALSDAFILLAYDSRYHAAAFMIPLLLVSVWFGTLSSFADSMLMGRGRPAPGAWANGTKFVIMLIGLPYAVARADMPFALGVLIMSEIGRWATLIPAARGERFAHLRDDFALSALMLASAVGFKVILSFVGLVPSLTQWWDLRELTYV